MRTGETVLTGPIESATSSRLSITADEFEELMRLHQRRIHRLLLGFVRDPDEADSLTQECFLRAYKNRDKFRGECSLGTWLTRIAVNLARDEAKNRKRSFWRRLLALDNDNPEATAIDAPANGASPERCLLAREQLNYVWRIVDRLPAQQRTAFLLRFVEEMSLEEIAQVLEVEVGTVKSHLSRRRNRAKAGKVMSATPQHLTDEQLATALARNSQLVPEAEEHLQQCAECRLERERLQTVLGSMQRDIRLAAQKPDGFWNWQLETTMRRTQLRLAPVPALASGLALIVISLLLFAAKPGADLSPATGSLNHAVQVPAISDEAILAEVERTLQRAAPPALEPAALIALELLDRTPSKPPAQVRQAKEKRNEI